MNDVIRCLREALRIADLPTCSAGSLTEDGRMVAASYPAKVGAMEAHINTALSHLGVEAASADDGAPYCSLGHPTKASCDCPPPAANE